MAKHAAHAKVQQSTGGFANSLLTVLIVLLFAGGAAFALYPVYSNLYYEYVNARAALEYESTVKAIDQDMVAEALAAAHRYNEAHRENVVVDPFDEKVKAADPDYEKLLNLTGDGVMGYIEIPKIGVKLVVYHGTTAEVLDKGVGHVQGTSLPVGGQRTHSVLSGHRGLPSAKLFTDLDQVGNGDVFVFHVLGEALAYEVDRTQVVKPEEVGMLAIQEGRDLMTLVTCTPYGVNTHRMVVTGHRVDYVAPEVDTPVVKLAQISPQALAIAGVMSLLALIALVMFTRYLVGKGGSGR